MRVPARNSDLPTVAQAVIEMAAGSTNACGTLTLASGATVTVVEDRRSSETARVFLSPRSANAAAAGAWISATAKGSFTVTHPSATTTDRIFDYLIQISS